MQYIILKICYLSIFARSSSAVQGPLAKVESCQDNVSLFSSLIKNEIVKKNDAVNLLRSKTTKMVGITAQFKTFAAAAKNCNLDLMKELLDAKPDFDINQRTKEGLSVLFAACQEGHGGMVRLLLSYPAIDINQEHSWGDHHGMTCLFISAMQVINRNLHSSVFKIHLLNLNSIFKQCL